MSASSSKSFSRFERNGIIFLSVLLILSIVFQRYIVSCFSTETSLSKADLQKINQLKVQIENAKNSYNYPKQINSVSTGTSMESSYKSRKEDFIIEINSASVEDYEKLYGVGKVLSQRIVKFRDKLGGFYSVSQIKDVWGIEDSVFDNFKSKLSVKPVKANKININEASYDELTANPYFFSTLAKQIIGFRTKVRGFETIEDVKQLYYVRDHPEVYDKIVPYISLN